MPTIEKVAKAAGKSINRTGMKLSAHEEEMREVSRITVPDRPNGTVAELKRSYFQDVHGIGSMPPPAGVKGVVKSGIDAIKGHDAFVLIDKMGERMAFERTGVRLYDALIEKLEHGQSWDGGPTLEQLRSIREEELEHFLLLKEELERMGGDPTVMTPTADLVAVESEGLQKVLADARTDVAQGMHAILVAELADGEGWALLTRLASRLEHDQLAERFSRAQHQESEHLRLVKGWLAAYTLPSP